MSVSGTSALSQLTEIVGEANVVRDPAQLTRYEIDSKTPSAAVRPGSEVEVAEIVKFAAREKRATVVSGAQTKLGIGMPPRHYDLAIDLGRMDRILAYDPRDLTLSAEAGAPLSKIASALAEHGQCIPLAVPFMARATIGGTIASGVDSPLRQCYGTPRDFVLGMNFVTGDGTAAKSGGRVVKNVSGYDIHKFMIGSLGTLGAITRVNFRTFPLPRQTRTFAAEFRGFREACAFRNAIARSVLRPRTLEIVSESARGQFLPPEQERPLWGDRRWSVYVSFAGDEDILKRDYQELRALGGAQDRLSDWLRELNPAEEQSVMSIVSEFPAAILKRSPAAAILKISALPAELPELASDMASIEMPWAVVIRGMGVAYLALCPPDASAGSLDVLGQHCARIFTLAGRPPFRQVTLPWCPPGLKRDIDIWGPLPPGFELMKKLKTVFDPAGILSPGRFLGGI
ncbi:MAG: FAD-binding oxidoreductase [Candidatus Acidiferrales bacterium]